MRYHGFFVKITPALNIPREDKYGIIKLCDGVRVEIFSDESERLTLDRFAAAVGFELMNDSEQEINQFVKDVIDSEEKEYRRILGQLDNSAQKV